MKYDNIVYRVYGVETPNFWADSEGPHESWNTVAMAVDEKTADELVKIFDGARKITYKRIDPEDHIPEYALPKEG